MKNWMRIFVLAGATILSFCFSTKPTLASWSGFDRTPDVLRFIYLIAGNTVTVPGEGLGRSGFPNLTVAYPISQLYAQDAFGGQATFAQGSNIFEDDTQRSWLRHPSYDDFYLHQPFGLSADALAVSGDPLQIRRVESIENPSHQGLVIGPFEPDYQQFYTDPTLQFLSMRTVYVLVLGNLGTVSCLEHIFICPGEE